ncbi:hypothetical protein Aduo_005517 [Ancylostoma duodenale]
MDDETCGWFSLSKGTLMVWEGVCALSLDDGVHLFKVRSGKILTITLQDADVKEVSSDGYWSCAEVTGCLAKEKGSFYYHADSPGNAHLLLKHLLNLPNVRISSLLVRLDPDPLRCRDIDWISERLATWSQFGRRFCSDARIVLDSNMPL